MGFITRAIAPAAIIVAVTVPAAAAFGGSDPDPARPAPPPDLIVAEDLATSMDWSGCWERPEDRWGRTPTWAVVKDDGTTTVRTVTADAALNLADDGKVWVLAWCE